MSVDNLRFAKPGESARLVEEDRRRAATHAVAPGDLAIVNTERYLWSGPHGGGFLDADFLRKNDVVLVIAVIDNPTMLPDWNVGRHVVLVYFMRQNLFVRVDAEVVSEAHR